MTELQQALALEGVVEWEGKSIRIGPTSVEVMGRWEDWLADETLQRLLRVLGKRPGGEDKAIRAVANQAAEGVFDFYGEASAKRMGELSGLKMLVFFRALQHDETISKAVTDAIVERDWEVMYRQIRKEMAAADALLPNDEAPKTGAAA